MCGAGFLIDGVTYNFVKSNYTCEALEPIRLKGKENPTPVFLVSGVASKTKKKSRSFKGRTDELSQMRLKLASLHT